MPQKSPQPAPGAKERKQVTPDERGARARQPDRTPPIARPEAPEVPDLGDNPEAAPGHYGPAYGDPTRHLGSSDALQGRPAAAPQPARHAAGGPAPGHSPREPASAQGPRPSTDPELAPD